MKSNNTVVFLYVKTLSHGDLPKKDYIILTCQTYRRAIEKNINVARLRMN